MSSLGAHRRLSGSFARWTFAPWWSAITVPCAITHTVQNWDAELTTRRVELAIGRDLQFIRINGTLVGALAGLLIYTISRFVP